MTKTSRIIVSKACGVSVKSIQSAYDNKKFLKGINTKIAFIPGSLISQLQPLNVPINITFKNCMPMTYESTNKFGISCKNLWEIVIEETIKPFKKMRNK